MNSETLKALKNSIKKWTAIVQSTEAEERGVFNCPLCRLFHSHQCAGCPVKEKTGMHGCQCSPYNAWDNHHEILHNKDVGESTSRYEDCPECLSLAKKEVEFLKGLLPKERKGVEK